MNSGNRVEELTGLYGPVFFAEKQVQRIWATRSFRQEGLVTRSGKVLEVLDPGRWNFQEGPDFRDAILVLDGRRCHGDVEIHLHERDWLRHKHGIDPNFDEVVLHVVLFPDRRDDLDQGEAGSTFETLEWLKYLDRDLETYFDDQGVDQLLDEGLPDSLTFLLDLPPEARESVLVRAARERWDRKVGVMQKRVEVAGRVATFHQIFLETLGLKRNRATMSRLAIAYPFEQWQQAPMETAAEAFASFQDDWHLAGCRPANHPRRRLESYGQWIAGGQLNGPERLIERPWRRSAEGGSLEMTSLRVARRRKEWELSKQEEEWRAIFAPGVVGSRFHTWIGDGLLPFLAAELPDYNGFPGWFVWPVGDVPDRMKRTLKVLEVTGPGRPLCNGWTQGIIRLLEPDYDPSSALGGA
ncbi:DUF2851 family protein [Puniceicoccus vermicola]|uniref:DUF2851 family protein n=1 Tax=Puniceicoccus vermicola TaxID=388746 RepID=A0A7X1AYV0_9BACT|nr:DUF2851 family protein [Puniceicoccus vermicola]MBC2601453.1 DUF2851 family protein [Puniceicoccus vermicola]